MIVLGAILVLLLWMYLRWRIAYGHPPADLPAVLCYHKLSESFRFEGTWTTPRRFVRQIESLRDRGYRFIGEDEFYDVLDLRSAGASCRSGSPRERSKTILLTFDDGYEDLYDVFFEFLVPHRVPVLVFLVTDYVGLHNAWDLGWGRRRVRHLAWKQIVEMIEAGAAFGVHGATHTDLTRASAAVLEREVIGSKRLVTERTGKAPRSFSFPFGRYDARVKAVCERAGYDGAFSLYPRHANGCVDRFALRRNAVYAIDTNLTLRWKLERTPFSWFEEMKCRAINAVAVLTPMLKRSSPGPDT